MPVVVCWVCTCVTTLIVDATLLTQKMTTCPIIDMTTTGTYIDWCLVCRCHVGMNCGQCTYKTGDGLATSPCLRVWPSVRTWIYFWCTTSWRVVESYDRAHLLNKAKYPPWLRPVMELPVVSVPLVVLLRHTHCYFADIMIHDVMHMLMVSLIFC